MARNHLATQTSQRFDHALSSCLQSLGGPVSVHLGLKGSNRHSHCAGTTPHPSSGSAAGAGGSAGAVAGDEGSEGAVAAAGAGA